MNMIDNNINGEQRNRSLNEATDILWEEGKLYFGTVKWFDRLKGYGFIVTGELSNDEEIDIFVHHSNIISPYQYKALMAGENVYFKIMNSEHGPIACLVQAACLIDEKEAHA